MIRTVVVHTFIIDDRQEQYPLAPMLPDGMTVTPYCKQYGDGAHACHAT